MTDTDYMKQALIEAQKAYERDEVPIGAIIVCKGRIVARAHNLTEALNDVTAHAEMQAITAAAANIGGKYLNDCTLYVTVEPCPMCAGAIGWSQLGKLVYGAEDEKRGYRRYAPGVLHPKTEVVSGVCADEATALMKEFFKNKR
ncbi:MAG: nucleoside deaminase [Bacteroidaceae bacterium]|nr:nucleoside deaminase [Bacteroidaceae bacterium]MBR3906625.1 nucleoside deaminase [Bacteroidaceae bacterium]